MGKEVKVVFVVSDSEEDIFFCLSLIMKMELEVVMVVMLKEGVKVEIVMEWTRS